METPAATFIADMVRAHPGEISILALGPLTNIALAMQLDAQVAPQLVSWGDRPLKVCKHVQIHSQTGLPDKIALWDIYCSALMGSSVLDIECILLLPGDLSKSSNMH